MGPENVTDVNIQFVVSVFKYSGFGFIMSSQAKKIRQDELRRLMNLEKKKLTQTVKKIESPLARYDKDGTLNCIICQAVVRSEAVWSVHLNSKKHRENVANKVKKKEEPPEQKPIQVLKRPAPSPAVPVSPKKVKSILKNAPLVPNYSKPVNSVIDNPETKSSSVITEETKSVPHEPSESSEEENEAEPLDTLPEGFFDDPKLDAKVRNVEYKDPIEEEWEQFQKEIREETSKAQQIIAEEQEEATTERQIEEIDEQIRNWNRVVNLEKKKQAVIAAPVPIQTVKEEESSGEEDNFEEFLDWRSKKSFE